MTTALFKDGFPSAHRNTRQRIEGRIDLRRLFSAIDADPALIGAGVVYIDEDFNVLTLREFQAVCSVQVKKVVLREAPEFDQGQWKLVSNLENPAEGDKPAYNFEVWEKA